MTAWKTKTLHAAIVGAMIVGVCQSHALTARDEERIIEKAERAQSLVTRYESMVTEHAKRLTTAQEKENAAKTHLARLESDPQAVVGREVANAEKSVAAASKKVRILTEEAEELNDKLTDAKARADEATAKMDQIRSQRRYEYYQKRLVRTRKQLDFFQERAAAVEVKERETRANAAAEARLATIGGSARERKLNSWQAEISESSANTLLDELKYYRDKIATTKEEIAELEEKFSAAEKEYSLKAGKTE